MNKGILAACVLLVLFIMASCKKDASHALGPEPYDGIRANDPPYFYYPFGTDNVLKFWVGTITTHNDYNHATSQCGNFPNVVRYTNTNGPNNITTYSNAIVYLTSDTVGSGAYLNGIQLPVANCEYVKNTYQLYCSNAVSLINPIQWSILKDSVVTFYIDSSIPPVAPEIISDSAVSTAVSFVLTGAGPASGDSVVFLLQGSKKTVAKVLASGSVSCSFSAAEMASLGVTSSGHPGLAQIIASSMHAAVVNGKQCSFIKQACFSQYVRFY